MARCASRIGNDRRVAQRNNIMMERRFALRAILLFSNFQKQTSRDMAKKFRVILRDVLSISKSQELLRTEAENIPANSPRKNNLASEQQLLQDQLYKTMKKTMNLSKETFLVTSDMGQSLGQANAQMGASKTKLSDFHPSCFALLLNLLMPQLLQPHLPPIS